MGSHAKVEISVGHISNGENVCCDCEKQIFVYWIGIIHTELVHIRVWVRNRRLNVHRTSRHPESLGYVLHE